MAGSPGGRLVRSPTPVPARPHEFRRIGRRRFVRGSATCAALALSPLASSQLLDGCDSWSGKSPGPSPTTTTEPAYTPRAGYTVWDSDASETTTVQGIYEMAPGLLRWYVDWDRFQSTNNPVNWSTYRPFMEALASVGATLYVQISNADWFPSWARVSFWVNYPTESAYQGFVDGLAAELATAGVDVVWEAYNEPDLRWGLLDIDGSPSPPSEPVQNYPYAWTINLLDLNRGYAKWTGGSGSRFAALHYDPERTYASCGVQGYTAWVQATAHLFGQIDLHHYFLSNSIDWYLSSLAGHLAKYDAVSPGLPFVIGEAGTSPTSAEPPADEFTRLRDRHDAVATEYGDRYIGMIALTPAARLDLDTGWWDA